jgi:hypothetical protein
MSLDDLPSRNRDRVPAAISLALLVVSAGCSGSGRATTDGSLDTTPTAAEPRIFVANPLVPSITVYSSTAGNVAPVATIEGDATGLTGTSGLALDASGRIYALNSGGR